MQLNKSVETVKFKHVWNVSKIGLVLKSWRHEFEYTTKFEKLNYGLKDMDDLNMYLDNVCICT